MTTLYRPVLIETSEQAEALPTGTSVKRAVWHQSGHQDYYAGVKVGFNAWFTTSPTADLQDALSRHMIGWSALVPVEAEEEGTRVFYGSNGTWHMTPPLDAYQSPHTRYVTRWERTS